MASAAKLFIEIDATTNGFASALGDIESRAQSLGKSVQNVGKDITKAGKGLTAGVTLPIVAVAGGAIKSAIDYESAFAGVRKTVNATEPELQALSEGIRSLSKEIPVSAVELASIAESAGQLGIQTGNILGFTQVMAALGVATNLTSTEAASALAQFANVTGLPQDQFDRLGSTIVALGNNLATTEADIVSMAQRLAGAGSVAGLTEAEILSLSGALSSTGIEAEAGGSAFSRVLIDISNAVAEGGDDLDKFADVAGVSADAFAQQFKNAPAEAILAFIGGLQRIQTEGGNVFATLDALGLGEIRVRDALLRAAGAGDLFANALAIGNTAWAENTALANEAAQRYGTTASQLQILQNRLVDVLITTGGPLVNALIAALTAAEPFFLMIERGANAFAAMDPGTQQTIIGIVGVVAAVGPALVVIGNLITIIGSAISLFSGLAGVAGTVAGAFGAGGPLMAALGAVAAFLTGPIGIAIAGVVLAVGGLYLAWRNNWFGMRDATKIATDGIRGWVDGLRTWLYSLRWPSWLGGGAVVTPPAVALADSGGFGGGGGGGGFGGGTTISPQAFPSASPTARSGANVQNNNINAPLIGQVTVRDEADEKRLMQNFARMMEEDFGIVVGQDTRYQYGFGTSGG